MEGLVFSASMSGSSRKSSKSTGRIESVLVRQITLIYVTDIPLTKTSYPDESESIIGFTRLELSSSKVASSCPFAL